MMQQLVHSRNTYLSYVSLDTMLDPSEGQKRSTIRFVLLRIATLISVPRLSLVQRTTSQIQLNCKTALRLLNKILLWRWQKNYTCVTFSILSLSSYASSSFDLISSFSLNALSSNVLVRSISRVISWRVFSWILRIFLVSSNLPK